jgi:hypothetical protein
MGLVAAGFSVKVHRRVARIRISRWAVTAIFAPEALLAGPRFYQRSIDAEVLVPLRSFRMLAIGREPLRRLLLSESGSDAE